QKFQMETQAAMAGGLRTYLKDRQVYHETFIYPPGHKPPAKSIVSPATDFGKASVVELRQGSFLRTVYPNLEEVFFTFLILPASSTPTLPRATCAMLIDPREIVRQYLQELQAAPDQLLNQEADFRTEYRMYLYDPLQKRLLQGTDPNLAENDFTLIAQRTINAGQGVTQNLLHSPRSRLVQSRIFHGFPGVAVAIGTPVQSTSAGISASTFLIVLILFSLLIVLLMSRFLSEILVEPFQVFQHGVTRIARGEYGTGIFLDTRDEFQQLGQSFNQLSEELAQKERMKRFLSERIIRAVECDAPGPPQQIQEASILVSDLRGFTTLSERHPPEQITAMLNSYFTTMEEAIQEEGGFIDSFIGDCLVAVFLPVADATTPAHRSLRAGIAMRRRLAEFNRERRQRGEFLIDNGVGIAIGPIITGLIKSGFKRRELGILGEPVREAHRLETQTRKARCSGIVVSQRLQDQLAATWTFTPLPDSRDAWELSLDLPVEGRTR
ncbi:MAG TPA: adenylate/guanylate cyclase domain-containing protein, partial [Candidatus Ozemobacteraceae bacterium]|nr:adenylate/guanylate cyclase domain-containing protein [Candidatus Ozemobacteraceae bacterium]